jgi:hypothetical protein
MSGDEIITITIEDPNTNKQISSRYSLSSVDDFFRQRGDYHLDVIDNLIERFNKEKHEPRN